MEFLVTMTAHLAQGTSEGQAADVGTLEAARSRELAVQGRLLRLWRMPLRPDEGCTLALFDADDEAHLHRAVAAAPPQIWRFDEVTPLGPHPNDPLGQGITIRPGKGPEFLITMTMTVPQGTPASTVDEAVAREAGRARDLAAGGHLVRFWTLADGPDGPRTLGLWRARDPGELMAILDSLPLSGWMTIETSPLRPHPHDPVRLS
ncbi:muconolactone Delta-isomerase family protein [Mycobacterium bourgelatii]|uniref:Muconolactone isomerase n=1 Tax=Mycobacterium bourgelatii TaxID=1273442 RepID=A0A7I9YHU8_MYCBU|nr:muconolactone Delta-isomerase family protein [Mycobacterium bourgelatii]MCV6976782.1 muconolactone Delta-isomerase family protein [Mycobacterium bourgelatii]GFG88073.1 muconolactone isomerase [Mycobacterium bourgelatii]